MGEGSPPSVDATSAILTSEEVDLLSSLSITEKLLMAQAVHQLGTNQMDQVTILLKDHALLKKQERTRLFCSTEKMTSIYVALAKDINIKSPATTEYPPSSPELLKLARKYYTLRVAELRDLIAKEQVLFKNTYAEIQEMTDEKLDIKMSKS